MLAFAIPSGGSRDDSTMTGILLFRCSETSHWYCSDAFTRCSSHARSKNGEVGEKIFETREAEGNGRRALLDVRSVKSFSLEF
jgi:hypothetical protein